MRGVFARELEGTQSTSFTGTKVLALLVQKYLRDVRGVCARVLGGILSVLALPGRRVQILTLRVH